MARFDDDETPKHVRRGRVSRLLKLGGLGTSVGASVVGDKLLRPLLSEEKRAQRSRRMLERNAERIVQTMGELKGAAMKLGQMLSTAPIDEARLPPELRQAFELLQREAPPMGWETVAAQIEAAFDRPITEMYRFFEPEPVAAASIGQVHRAQLFDGRQVAVKVQYPGVRESLDDDLGNLATLAQLTKAFVDRERVDAIIEEVRETLLAESDYEAEARNLDAFAKLFAERSDIRIPAPVHSHTRTTVLTMEYVEGEKLDTYIEGLEEPKRTKVAASFIELFAWMFHIKHVLHADPHPGNFLVDEAGRFVLLDFGCVKRFDPAFTDGFLELLVCLYNEDYDRLPLVYEDLGFGSGAVTVPGPVIGGWLEIALAPLLHRGPFDWGRWDPKTEMNRYLMRHPALLKLVPPEEAVFYFRVCGAAWGFLKRLKIVHDFRRSSEAIARARGFEIRNPWSQ
ncbi:MAG: AarF/ABC1/UbiB kinase family protein [Deltaproteobacteria bacterium]|nr:MAG: AarF/ABC1/UbiB kinase family protein [Deltaproteobacteria bacterium]